MITNVITLAAIELALSELRHPPKKRKNYVLFAGQIEPSIRICFTNLVGTVIMKGGVPVDNRYY